MEQLSGSSPGWEDDALIAELRRQALQGDETPYLQACRGWTTERARVSHDLAPDDALAVADGALADVQRTNEIYLQTWLQLKVMLGDLVATEAGRRAGDLQYGLGDEHVIRNFLRRGASKVDFAEVTRTEEAAQNAWVYLLSRDWYSTGQRRGRGYYTKCGYHRALDLSKSLNRVEPTEDSELAGAPDAWGEAPQTAIEDIALATSTRDALRLQVRDRLPQVEAHDYCLYHPRHCARAPELRRDLASACLAIDVVEDSWTVLHPHLERYRDLTNDRTQFMRTVRRCSDWLTYEAFSNTLGDTAHGTGNTSGDRDLDELRWQLVRGWALHEDGTWNSQRAPLRQVRLLVAEDPLFAPLLVRNKPDVARFLELTATTDTTGAL